MPCLGHDQIGGIFWAHLHRGGGAVAQGGDGLGGGAVGAGDPSGPPVPAQRAVPAARRPANRVREWPLPRHGVEADGHCGRASLAACLHAHRLPQRQQGIYESFLAVGKHRSI